MDRLDVISWRTWNRDGYSVRDSKEHVVNPDNKSITLCGTRIPAEGNGIEYDDCFVDGICKRCQKAEARRDDEDRAENERLDKELDERHREEKRAEGQWQEFGT